MRSGTALLFESLAAQVIILSSPDSGNLDQEPVRTVQSQLVSEQAHRLTTKHTSFIMASCGSVVSTMVGSTK